MKPHGTFQKRVFACQGPKHRRGVETSASGVSHGKFNKGLESALEPLEFHGYGAVKSLELVVFELAEKTVKTGGCLGYRMILRNASKLPLKVMLDYAIHHRKANGSLSPKVFKGRVRELAPGEVWEIAGSHSFKPVTMRVYHPGVHRFEPRINGKAFPGREFVLR